MVKRYSVKEIPTTYCFSFLITFKLCFGNGNDKHKCTRDKLHGNTIICKLPFGETYVFVIQPSS